MCLTVMLDRLVIRRIDARDISPGLAPEVHGGQPLDTHADHAHGHGACGHSHAISRRLNEAHISARERADGNRVRRALAIAAFGAARVVASSFCPLDDLVPLAMQVVHPAATSIEQDQFAVLPRSSGDLESGVLRLRAHGHHVPLEGPEPPEGIALPTRPAETPPALSVAQLTIFMS